MACELPSVLLGSLEPDVAVKEQEMATFRSILFPVDFSERCRFAAPFVRMMAEQCRADLTVMHVIELPVSVYSTIGHEIMLDLPAMRRAAREQLETFVRAELAGIKLRSAVEEGRAASSIAHFADEHGIDLFDSSLV